MKTLHRIGDIVEIKVSRYTPTKNWEMFGTIHRIISDTRLDIKFNDGSSIFVNPNYIENLSLDSRKNK